jgi:hypothetical protein
VLVNRRYGGRPKARASSRSSPIASGWRTSKGASNVDLRFIEMRDPEQYVRDLREQVGASGISAFDAIIVDGGYRPEAAALAPSLRAPEGVIICDDSEGYDIFERLRDSGLNRVDFFGFAPGVILPRCTSLYFGQTSLFSAAIPVKRAE